MLRLSLLLLILAALLPGAPTMIWEEDFLMGAMELPSRGWFIADRSDPAGPDGWTNGDDGFMAGREGGADYVMATLNTEQIALDAILSAWLVTPVIDLRVAGSLAFWTRALYPADAPGGLGCNAASCPPDSMQVLMWKVAGTDAAAQTAISGSGIPDGTGIGDFVKVLEINPDLLVNGYPQEWSPYSITFAAENALARVAFRYYVTNTTTNGTLVGIDDVRLYQTPEPGTMLLLGGALAGLGFIRRRSNHQTL